jgi:nucleotide-binding universal stress UspA family protein
MTQSGRRGKPKRYYSPTFIFYCMKTIVAPTDFSTVSLNAVNYAADLASALSNSLSLINVFQLPVINSDVPVVADNFDGSLRAAEEKMQQLKEEIIKRTDGKVEIYTEVLTGPVIEETENYCASVQPFAAVMATQGAGAMERFLFGSNTVSAMKNLGWPLIVVPPGAKFTGIKKIGLACDMKKVALTAPVNEIKILIKEFKAELHVLHIRRDAAETPPPGTDLEFGLLQQLLAELNPVYDSLVHADINEGLVEFAETNKIDLLVVVPKKHNLIDQLFHKSHTKHLLLHTHVPLMSVHE